DPIYQPIRVTRPVVDQLSLNQTTGYPPGDRDRRVSPFVVHVEGEHDLTRDLRLVLKLRPYPHVDHGRAGGVFLDPESFPRVLDIIHRVSLGLAKLPAQPDTQTRVRLSERVGIVEADVTRCRPLEIGEPSSWFVRPSPLHDLPELITVPQWG